jgi:hypothetical protein
MGSNVGMPLLVSLVLADVMEVISADDDGAIHLGRFDTAGEDTSTDGNVTSEWALVVNIVACDRREMV